MIQPTGSSRNGAISSAARRTSHLKRIVPANGSWTPIVAVNSGHTRANSARICRRDGRSMPRLIRLRWRYGSISSQHHGAITAAGVYHGPVKNLEIARLFHEMAGLLEVQSGSVFRVRAYQRAAQTLEALADSVEAVAGRGEVGTLPGIGRDLAAKIGEYLVTGRIAQLEELRSGLPPTLLTLLEIRGLGPKTAKLLYDRLGADSVERLEALAESGEILRVPGIREKTRANILRGIALWKAGRARTPRHRPARRDRPHAGRQCAAARQAPRVGAPTEAGRA